jgi:hypothetical protein
MFILFFCEKTLVSVERNVENCPNRLFEIRNRILGFRHHPPDPDAQPECQCIAPSHLSGWTQFLCTDRERCYDFKIFSPKIWRKMAVFFLKLLLFFCENLIITLVLEKTCQFFRPKIGKKQKIVIKHRSQVFKLLFEPT